MHRVMVRLAGLWMACWVLLWGTAALADDGFPWRVKGAGPTFAEIVKQSDSIVFAQVANINGSRVQIAVSKVFKGKPAESAWVTGFSKLTYNAPADPHDLMQAGQDYIFFFTGSLGQGMAMAEPTPDSVVLHLDRNKIKTSILSPVYPAYARDLDFEVFTRYLEGLVAKDAGREQDPVFIGQLKELLDKEAANPDSADAASYLFMLKQLTGPLDNEALLFKLMDAKNVNGRVLALHALTDLALTLRQKPVKSDEPKALRVKGKTAPKVVKAVKQDTSPFGRIQHLFVEKLKNDPSALVRSLSAQALSTIGAESVIQELASAFEKNDRTLPELCEAVPVKDAVEAPIKAAVRAIVECDSDDTLDILEREFNRNNVDSSRLMLEVFRDYTDQNLTLLLLDLMQDRNYLPRQVAILEYFRSIRDETTIKSLKALFLSSEASSEYIRKSIMEVFENYKSPAQLGDFIVKYGLHDKSPVVRQAAAQALGNTGDERLVTEVLGIYFSEPDRLAREFYVDNLSKIKTRSAYEALLGLKAKEQDRKMLKNIDFALSKSKFLSQ